ncbi:MAG: energy-coupling factor transporter transmembrane protein EcfT [Clostridia bacterium]|nr:energy-coupling factor transporter transmembrane protein EcfT [Oscillospiraceae bacterium]MBP3599899.1 energy-coupling factor transporter transmembrane protein EcfT [Clostridia bacterium]
MLKDITFGQYYDCKSLLHRLDARIKIILMIIFIVFIFISKNIFSLLFAAMSVFAITIISRVPFKLYLKNMKAILPVLIFTAVINIFYGDGGKVLVHFWVIEITTAGLYRSFFMALRILLLIFISSALTYTTTPNDLTDAIESLLSPLKFIGLKSAVHTLAMMMTIALRFIPTLIEEAEKIMNAQKARGADLESGGLLDRIKALIPILIPLLMSAVRRAYELAEAMECRCYNGGEGKTRMKQMHLKKADLFSFIVVALMCGSIVALNILL